MNMHGPSAIRIVIADDHVLIREGLKEIVREEPDIELAGEAGNATELMDVLARSECHVLILDINLPGRSGFEALEEIRKNWPKLPVLVLSVHPEDPFAVRALKSGASGYITKTSAADELVGAIRTVSVGRRYITPAVAEAIALGLGDDSPKPVHERLSNREFQVLRLLAAGKSIKAISSQISISANTVSTYRARLLQKMGLRSDAELIRYAIEHHLID